MPSNTTDQRLRFVLPKAGVRGVAVHLGPAWSAMRQTTDYPPQARNLLGQAVVATALLSGHVKLKGRLSIQLRGQAGLRTLFAECTAAGTVRGIARLDDGTDAPADLTGLGTTARLAITIENPGLSPHQPQRYQSLIALHSARLTEALEGYFQQSEQLPTRLQLAADTTRATGLMLQKLPGGGGEEDGWRRASTLLDTLGPDELQATPPNQLLRRLFLYEGVSILDTQPLHFACSCSRERMGAVLQSLGQEHALAAAQTGQAEVICEFCGRRCLFSPDQITTLFTGPALTGQSGMLH